MYFRLIDYCCPCKVLRDDEVHGENVLIRYVSVFVFLTPLPSFYIGELYLEERETEVFRSFGSAVRFCACEFISHKD